MSDLDLSAVAAAIGRRDDPAQVTARERRAARPEARGRLDELAVWLSGAHGTAPPRRLERVLLAVAAGHAPAAAELAAGLGVEVRAVSRPADDAASALRSGMAFVDQAVDRGTDLLLLADADPAADVAASALVGVLTRNDASAVTRRGPTIDDAGWMRRCAEVRDLMRAARPVLGDHVALLDTVGRPDLAAATGVLLQAAARRTPVVLDGPATAASALVAQRVAFRAADWWVAGHRSPEPAHGVALERLGLEPLLDLGIREEDGTGALLAVPLLRAAAALSR